MYDHSCLLLKSGSQAKLNSGKSVVYKGILAKKENSFSWLNPQIVVPYRKAGIGDARAKLAVGGINDRFEAEAESVADRVVGSLSSGNAVQSFLARNVTRFHQAEGEGVLEKPLVARQAEEEEEPVQTRQEQPGTCVEQNHGAEGFAAGSESAGSDFETLLNGSGGKGRKMDAPVQAFMESRFGVDFSDVNIHTGAEASRMNRLIRAKAFTYGNDIYFNQGQFSPSSREGMHLLAHELTHVIQQGNGMLKRKEIRRTPDVDFQVTGLVITDGQLGEPSQENNTVSWAVDFGVNSPIVAEATVRVTGSAGDNCSGYTIGFLQTVHSQWLHYYYFGRRRGDGSIVSRTTCSLPIRDGDPGSIWYSDVSHASPGGCNSNVNVTLDDYPTIFNLPKVKQNTETNNMNYLTGVSRGLHCVAFLVARAPGGNIIPLRHFYWNYQQEISFTPNYDHPEARWTYAWRKNRGAHSRISNGAGRGVPFFRTATRVYNSSLTQRDEFRR